MERLQFPVPRKRANVRCFYKDVFSDMRPNSVKGATMRRFAVVAVAGLLFSAASPVFAADLCSGALEGKSRTVTGRVESVDDSRARGFTAEDGVPQYRLIVQDEATHCAIVVLTDTACQVGQRATVMDGRFGMYNEFDDLPGMEFRYELEVDTDDVLNRANKQMKTTCK
jgi:hypothetical protein